MRDASPIFPNSGSFGVLDRTVHAAPAAATGAPKPLTVTQLTGQIRLLLESKFSDILVEGEVSGVSVAGSGHCYFNLKDSGAQIRCVIWGRERARVCKQLPKDGDKVEITGALTLYDKRGEYQVNVSKLRPAGLGRLWMQFQEMKERLEREGLFDPRRKRPIPEFPKKIGIVTSPTGAAIRDILKVLGRRAPNIEVIIWPARVQGEGSATEVAHGINRLNALNAADVLIVGRGGGSLEDLWAFNEEVVAQAIFRSKIPVISAVGHETDTTIADFVADLRAPTPSAAAEIVAKDSNEKLRDLQHTTTRMKRALWQRYAFLRQVPHLQARMEGAVLPRVRLMRSRLEQFQRSHAAKRPLHKLNEMRQELDEYQARLLRGLDDKQKHARQVHARLSAHLNALNPKAILGRGYSITFDAASGKIVRRANETILGQPLKIVLGEGSIDANVASANAFVVSKPARKARGGKATVIEWFGDVEELAALPAPATTKKRVRPAD